MGKNYIKEVARVLGVELGEKFDIKQYKHNPYYLLEDGLYDNTGCVCQEYVIVRLILGKLEIIKKPWTPKDGETYFCFNSHGEVIVSVFYSCIDFDCAMLRMGNYFRTREEAQQHKEKWLEYMKQEPDLSWRE